MSLDHRIAVIVPSTINANETAPQALVAQWIRASKVKFARLFGGFTAHTAVGGWVSPDHGLIEEPVTVIASYTDDDGLEFIDRVRCFAAEMAEALRQEAVSIEIDHQLEFVSPVGAAA